VSGNGHLPRPAWCNDLSREIEVMRHVILQENVRLKDQLRELTDESIQLRNRLGVQIVTGADGRRALVSCSGAPPTAGEPEVQVAGWSMPAAELGSSTSVLDVPWRGQQRVVEWRINGLNGPQAAELRERDRSTFELAEYPGVVFSLSFGAQRSRADTGAAGNGALSEGSAGSCGAAPCRLRLSISGPDASRFCLRVGLEVDELLAMQQAEAPAQGTAAVVQFANGHEREGAGGGYPDGGSSSSDDGGEPSPRDASPSGSSHAVSLGRLAPVALQPGGQVVCCCSWPVSSSANIICRVQIEFTGFSSEHPQREPLRLVTACSASQ